jgi:hypothetical protein
MSYLIAFVQFSTTGEIYPVECFRTDIIAGDVVLVQIPQRALTTATVAKTGYLNWNCSGQLKCKISEATQNQDGTWAIQKLPTAVSMVTSEAAISELKRLGWVSLHSSKTYMAALTNSNNTASGNILFRRNGVDFQIIHEKRFTLPHPFTLKQESTTVGRFVRHYLSHTTFNLYEGVLRFASSFISNEDDYDRFFKTTGSSDKRTVELKKETAQRRRQNSNAESGDVMSQYFNDYSDGSGNPVYLGDGMWVGSGGSLHDLGH